MNRRTFNILLTGFALTGTMTSCQSLMSLLKLPLEILKIGLSGVEWGVRNAAGLAPLAAMLAMGPKEDGPPQSGDQKDLERLLLDPPKGALSVLILPTSRLENPRHREEITRALLARTPGARHIRLVPIDPNHPVDPTSLQPNLPAYSLAPDYRPL